MRVIITGGTGMIGTALAEALLADGHAVIVLSRFPLRKGAGVPDGARVVGWDAKSGEAWADQAEAADAIVNLAGLSLASGRWTESRKRRIRASRLEAGAAVVDAVRRTSSKPRVVIQASGADYYGSGSDEPRTESASPGDTWIARLTVDWEASTSPVRDMGVRHVTSRTGVVFARQAIVYKLMTLPFRLFVGGPVGSGRQWLTWIHLQDAVRALRHLIEREDATGPYNLAAPEPVRNRDFARTVGQVLGRPSFIPVPGLVLRLALGEMAALALEGQPVMPVRLQEEGFEFLYPTLRPALEAIEHGGPTEAPHINPATP